MVAAFLYGIAGILISAFIRNPTLMVGDPYLLAPIAAAVLGGTAMSGGIGSMTAVAGAALFLTQLGQVLQMLGLSSALQFVIQGIAIALGMALSGIDFAPFLKFAARAYAGKMWPSKKLERLESCDFVPETFSPVTSREQSLLHKSVTGTGTGRDTRNKNTSFINAIRPFRSGATGCRIARTQKTLHFAAGTLS